MKKLFRPVVLQLMIIIALVLIIVSVLIVISKNNKIDSKEREKIQVVASFYPLAEFAQQVGGERVTVVNLVPPGVEPHNFEPNPQAIAKIYAADLFIFNGSNFDLWGEKLQNELEKRQIATINLTKHFKLLENLDPHIWLDPVLAKKEVEIIRDTLKKIDLENSQEYESNSKKYLSQLSALDKKYQDGLTSCSIREVIVSHNAFSYLAKRYGINSFPITGLTPDQEPTTIKMAEIADLARQKNIHYIFFETLVSPKIAETIAKEIGAKTLVFNPIEGLTKEELANGKDYFSIMEENLKALRQALICQ